MSKNSEFSALNKFYILKQVQGNSMNICDFFKSTIVITGPGGQKNLATPLASQLRQRVMNFMLLFFRICPWSIPKSSYATDRTVETTSIEFCVTDFQNISMVESKNLITPLAVQLRQRVLNFVLLIFRVFPWSSPICYPARTRARSAGKLRDTLYLSPYNILCVSHFSFT